MNGSFVLILHTHLPYVLRNGKWPHGSDWLCEAAVECYIPILNECRALLEEEIVPNITISFSPVVLEQLADPEFPAVLNDYLDEKIHAAEADLKRVGSRRSDPRRNAAFWAEFYRAAKEAFNDRYRCNLPAAFRELLEAGAIDIQTCGATHGYFPLLGYDESIRAQVRLAVETHQRHFGRKPRGIWMPECAYRPGGERPEIYSDSFSATGPRLGVERILAGEGLEYTIVDSHLTRGGRPPGTYGNRFTASTGSDEPTAEKERSLYEIYRIGEEGCSASDTISVFTRDAHTTLQVWSGAFGYPGDPEYLEFHKKHHDSGLRYWRVTDSGVDLAGKELYRPERAAARIREQAAHFVALLNERLEHHRTVAGHPGTLTAPFDTELFGHWWFEGPRFLGEVMRQLARHQGVRARTAGAELDARGPGPSIELPEGSWGEGGDHRVWFNEQTAWSWLLVHEVEKRLLELVQERDPDDRLQERLLRQAAREALLLQASDWQFLISTESAADYAEERLRGHYEHAMRLFRGVEAVRGGEAPDELLLADLQKMEETNALFDDINPDLWLPRYSTHVAECLGEEAG